MNFYLKKCLLVVLGVLFLFLLTACKDDEADKENETVIPTEKPTEHTHVSVNEWHFDTKNHWYKCECGEVMDLVNHTFDNGVVTKEPSFTAEGVKTYSCSCGYSYDEAIDKLVEEPFNENKFTIMWVSDPQWYSFKYFDRLESQNDWILENYLRLNTKYIVHTGDFVDLPNVKSQWESVSAQYDKWDKAGLQYGVLAGNHDVYLGSYDEYKSYFGADRFKDKECYGGDYDNNRGHYDYVTVGGVEFIFIYLGFGEKLTADGSKASGYVTAEDYAWLNKVLKENSDKIAFLCVHEYLSDSGVRTSIGQGFFDNVVLPNPNVRAVLCGHNDASHRIVDDIDDNGDGIADRTVYQMMANYQDTPNGGDAYFRIMEFDLDAGTISNKTYSPYLNDYSYFPDLESEKDIYGYRDEFVLPFDFSKPKADTDNKTGVVVKNAMAKIGDIILPIRHINENITSLDNAAIYDFKYSIDATDAYKGNCSYIVTEYEEGKGYVVKAIYKNSLEAVTISHNTRVIIVSNNAVDATGNKFDINSIKVNDNVIFDKVSGLKDVTKSTGITINFETLDTSFIINKVNKAVSNDDWALYDRNWGNTTMGNNSSKNTWNMVFVFTPISNGKYKITELNITSGVDKEFTIPEGGFALAINSYSALDKFRNSIKNNFVVGTVVTLNGYTPK